MKCCRASSRCTDETGGYLVSHLVGMACHGRKVLVASLDCLECPQHGNDSGDCTRKGWCYAYVFHRPFAFRQPVTLSPVRPFYLAIQKNGKSPLHYAVEHLQLDAAQLILDSAEGPDKAIKLLDGSQRTKLEVRATPCCDSLISPCPTAVCSLAIYRSTRIESASLYNLQHWESLNLVGAKKHVFVSL